MTVGVLKFFACPFMLLRKMASPVSIVFKQLGLILKEYNLLDSRWNIAAALLLSCFVSTNGLPCRQAALP